WGGGSGALALVPWWRGGRGLASGGRRGRLERSVRFAPGRCDRRGVPSAGVKRYGVKPAIAVRGALAEADGPSVDVLEPHRIELARGSILALAVVDGVHQLVQEGRHRSARHLTRRIPIAARFEFAAQ